MCIIEIIATPNTAVHKFLTVWYEQDAQLSQRGRAMLYVTEYFAKSLEVTQSHSKWHLDRGRV